MENLNTYAEWAPWVDENNRKARKAYEAREIAYLKAIINRQNTGEDREQTIRSLRVARALQICRTIGYTAVAVITMALSLIGLVNGI